ncbi:MAG: Na+ dependent nucleoside transporter, partial [Flavobacteriaceae bacterium]
MPKKILAFTFLFLLTISAQAQELNNQITPNQGFSFDSIWRGVLGMIVLILIAYLFSSNRKAIQWKTVGIGLSIQLLIAIGVLKVKFIQIAFETVGQIFVSVLDF